MSPKQKFRFNPQRVAFKIRTRMHLFTVSRQQVVLFSFVWFRATPFHLRLQLSFLLSEREIQQQPTTWQFTCTDKSCGGSLLSRSFLWQLARTRTVLRVWEKGENHSHNNFALVRLLTKNYDRQKWEKDMTMLSVKGKMSFCFVEQNLLFLRVNKWNNI